MAVKPDGPLGADVMIVGEAPGENEVAKGRPFVGYSGQLLDSCLASAGFNRDQCRVLNVCNERPPGNDMTEWMPLPKIAQAELLASGKGVEVNGRIIHRYVAEGLQALLSELESHPPKLIIAVGNTPLWAICQRTGITKWRGSHLAWTGRGGTSIPVLPTYHPAAVLRQWDLKPTFISDLKRAARILKDGDPPPKWNFRIRPTYDQVMLTLNMLLGLADGYLPSTLGVDREPLLLSVDIETRAQHTSCLGIAWTLTDAICIPFVSVEPQVHSGDEPDHHYWTDSQEVEIVWALHRLLTHPRVEVVGQNFIYDAQYIFRHWGFIPRLKHDTMVAQHVCFPRMPKSLDFISSLYNTHYIYWKDDGKDWRGDADEDRYWTYNCEDCVRTLECHYALQSIIARRKLTYPYNFQMGMWLPCLRMMIRGVDVNMTQHALFKKELTDYASHCQAEVNYMVGWDLNPRSAPQMQKFFYEEMGLPIQRARGKDKKVTCDDEALDKLAKKEPGVRAICHRIQEIRSCKTVLANALKPALGWDGKMHSSFNIAGPYTYRLSSSTDAFGSGMNLQNITSGEKE